MTEIQTERIFPTCGPATGGATVILTALVAAAVDIGASLMLRYLDVSPAARIAMALLPVPANVWLLVMIVRSVRKLDEFQKRVHLEAVVIAFLATGLAVFVYGYLQKAQAVGALNMGLVWGFMGIFYALGYFIAARHYR
jgi:Kef-type K+ transport system membrane component KefB